jgi:hypothetical protein
MNSQIGTRIVTALGCVVTIMIAIAPMSGAHAQAMGDEPQYRDTYLTSGEQTNGCFSEQLRMARKHLSEKMDARFLADLRRRCAGKD